MRDPEIFSGGVRFQFTRGVRGIFLVNLQYELKKFGWGDGGPDPPNLPSRSMHGLQYSLVIY